MIPVLVVVIFPQAREASRALQSMKRHPGLEARNTAVLVRDRVGEVHLFETGAIDPEYAALLGGLVGLLEEVLVGELAGLPAEDLPYLGLSQKHLSLLERSLQPGGSCLVTLIEPEKADKVQECLATYGGRVWQQQLAIDQPDRLASSAVQGKVTDEDKL
jgi:uncharacterized membrane protein